MPKLKLPQTLKINELNAHGEGVVQFAENVSGNLPFTAPGDVVTVNSVYKKKRQFYSLDYELTETSPLRVTPQCQHFGKAGGCSMQHLLYSYQLRYKQLKLEQLLGKYLPATNTGIQVLPAPQVTAYRNRVDIVITPEAIGFREKGKWWSVIDVESCILFSEKVTTQIQALKEMITEHKLTARNLKSGEGFLRYLVVREGKFTNQIQVNLVTAAGELPLELDNVFQADSINHLLNNTPADTSYGEVKQTWGQTNLQERLLDTVYEIPPNSFFQTNSSQAENLLRTVAEQVSGENILDFYCGVGTFSVYLAKQGKKVTGVDVDDEAITTAKLNAEKNKVAAEFQALSDKDIKHLEWQAYDTVIIDPPRAGLHKNAIELLLQQKPQEIIYVSCNPKTLAQNLEQLTAGYEVTSVSGLDMFPHTPHVEVVVRLERVGD